LTRNLSPLERGGRRPGALSNLTPSIPLSGSERGKENPGGTPESPPKGFALWILEYGGIVAILPSMRDGLTVVPIIHAYVISPK